jgi:hypothetical protein
MPKAPFSAGAWRRPGGGSIPSGIRRVPAKFTVPGPSGHEIGQLADVMTRRTRDCSPDAMGVVPDGGRGHVRRQSQRGVQPSGGGQPVRSRRISCL